MSKTYGEQFEEALSCNTKEEAEAWMASEIKRHVDEFGQSAEKARSVIMTNIGYMAGYYDQKTSEKIYRLFGAAHPVFGTPNYWSTVTPEDAFEKGRKMAEEQGEKK